MDGVVRFRGSRLIFLMCEGGVLSIACLKVDILAGAEMVVFCYMILCLVAV